MPKGSVLNRQARELVIKVRDYFEAEYQNGGPLLPLSQVRERVAAALGISGPTVSKITTEATVQAECRKIRFVRRRKNANHVV